MGDSKNTGLFSASLRRSSARWLAAGTLALGALLVPELAHAAEKILIVQRTTSDPTGNAAANAAQALMLGLGYDTTLIQSVSGTVPVNVTDYAQVYLISGGKLSDASAQRLVDYVKAGGRLYLSGDRPNPTTDIAMTVVQDQVLKPLIANSATLQVGTGIDGGNGMGGVDPLTFVAEKMGIAMHPNVLTTLYANDPGVIGGVSDDHIFAKDASSRPIGALWTRDDLVQGTGCVMLVMDINWWDVPNEIIPSPVTTSDLAQVAANFHDFLSFCGDHDRDGIMDFAEGPLGTNPANPDSDGDGLCDGTAAVDDPLIPQKCVAGENAAAGQDTDGDGLIDALDDDDDNDGILTKTELADVTQFGEGDLDNIPAWLDLDSDDDGIPDMQEGRQHFNSAGVPDYLDPNYPTPQPTSSSTSTGSGPGTSSSGSGSASSGTGGGGSSSDDSGGGCGCVVADRDDAPARNLGWVGLLGGLVALVRRSSGGAAKKRRSAKSASTS